MAKNNDNDQEEPLKNQFLKSTETSIKNNHANVYKDGTILNYKNNTFVHITQVNWYDNLARIVYNVIDALSLSKYMNARSDPFTIYKGREKTEKVGNYIILEPGRDDSTFHEPDHIEALPPLGWVEEFESRMLNLEKYLVGISHRKIEESIAKLKEMGLLRRIDSARGGNWGVVA